MGCFQWPYQPWFQTADGRGCATVLHVQDVDKGWREVVQLGGGAEGQQGLYELGQARDEREKGIPEGFCLQRGGQRIRPNRPDSGSQASLYT